MLRDRFFLSCRDTSGQKAKIRYKLRSDDALEVRCVSQIAFCEFKWIFRAAQVPASEAASFLKKSFIEPLLCVVGATQQEAALKPLLPSQLISQVDFSPATLSIMEQYEGQHQSPFGEAPNSIEGASLTSFEYDDDLLGSGDTTSILVHAFGSQDSPKERRNAGPGNTRASSSPTPLVSHEVKETEDELQRKIQMEQKINRLKRKRKEEVEKAQKRRKIQLV